MRVEKCLRGWECKPWEALLRNWNVPCWNLSRNHSSLAERHLQAACAGPPRTSLTPLTHLMHFFLLWCLSAQELKILPTKIQAGFSAPEQRLWVTCAGHPRTFPNHLRNPVRLIFIVPTLCSSACVSASSRLFGLAERTACWRRSAPLPCEEGPSLAKCRKGAKPFRILPLFLHPAERVHLLWGGSTFSQPPRDERESTALRAVL